MAGASVTAPGAPPQHGAAPRASGGLLTRVVTGVALAAVAIAAVWAGGIAFTALVMVAVLLMSTEWSVMHGILRGFRVASLVALAFTGAVATTYGAADALIVLAASAAAIGLFMRGYDRRRAFWVAAGLLYCGLPMIALLWLRGVPEIGLRLTSAVLAIVWATDVAAFFIGRAVGGPKFAPRISPNKTWAGVAGGTVAAAAAGALGGYALAGLTPVTRIDNGALVGALALGAALVGGLLGVVAIGGDLFESWLKRRAGVKDSGNLLPGHGGVMDRIDGLVPVTVVAAVLACAGGIGR